MKTYLETKVPVSYNVPWFAELRKVLMGMWKHHASLSPEDKATMTPLFLPPVKS